MTNNFNNWKKPAYLGIQWIGGNTPPTPMVEISREEGERLMFCGIYALQGINFEQVFLDGQKYGEGPMWSLHHYFYPENALTVATRYAHHDPTLQGLWLPDRNSKSNGYYLRFFRLGCTHPNRTSEWVQMHDRRDKCPDCDFTAQYDTSG